MWNKISKPLRVLLGLALLIAVSMAGYTLAAYVKTVNLFQGGWVGPKYFAFEVNGNSESQTVAPGGSASFPFSVSNYNNGGTAQVPLNVSISITYPQSLAGTGAVEAKLTLGGSTLATSTNGTLECNGAALPQNVQTTDKYTLTLTWLNADIAYLGTVKTSTFNPSDIKIRVSGYQ